MLDQDIEQVVLSSFEAKMAKGFHQGMVIQSTQGNVNHQLNCNGFVYRFIENQSTSLCN